MNLFFLTLMTDLYSSSSFPYSSSNLCHMALSLAIRRCILTWASYCRILLSASTMDPNAMPDI